MITLNEIGAETPAWELNLNARPYGDPDDPDPMIETAEVERRRGLVFREHHRGHASDAHPPVLVHGDGPLQLRRQRLRRGITAAANGVPQLDVATLAPFLKSRLMAPPPEETGLKDTVKANPGAGHGRARQVHTADHRVRRRSAHGAKVRAPLPHRRTRRQRHDGTRARTAVTAHKRQTGTGEGQAAARPARHGHPHPDRLIDAVGFRNSIIVCRLVISEVASPIGL